MTHPAELINQLTNAQNQIWQAISQSVTEASGHPIAFGNPLTIQTQAADLYAEISSPMIVISFAFADQPENTQVILINQETAANIISVLKNDDVTAIDENTVTDFKSTWEAIVHGICLAVGQIRNNVCLAVGLTAKFQIVSLPANIAKAEWLGRVQAAVTVEELGGTITWLLDPDSVGFTVFADNRDGDAMPFLQLETNAQVGMGSHGEDARSLNLIMDVPLEISVELGRVKMLVKDVLELGSGAIIEIDKAAGEPVDVMVNGTLVARGEVVVIEDNFGVRITEIVHQEHRIGEVA